MTHLFSSVFLLLVVEDILIFSIGEPALSSVSAVCGLLKMPLMILAHILMITEQGWKLSDSGKPFLLAGL